MEAGLSAGMWIAAAVVGWAGVSKITRPGETRIVLRLAGLPSSGLAVRSLGLAEIIAATAALTVGGRVSAAVLAGAYAAFALFAHRQRRAPRASCGCFGDRHAPVTGLHVVINSAGAMVTLAAALVGVPGLGTMGTPRTVTLAAAISTVAATCLVTQYLTSVPLLAQRMAQSQGVTSQGVTAQGADEAGVSA